MVVCMPVFFYDYKSYYVIHSIFLSCLHRNIGLKIFFTHCGTVLTRLSFYFTQLSVLCSLRSLSSIEFNSTVKTMSIHLTVFIIIADNPALYDTLLLCKLWIIWVMVFMLIYVFYF